MKKKFLLIVFLSFSFSFSQPIGKYTIDLSGYGYQETNAKCRSHISIGFLYTVYSGNRPIKDDYHYLIEELDFRSGNIFSIVKKEEIEATKVRKFRQFVFWGQRGWKNWFGCNVGAMGTLRPKVELSFPFSYIIYESFNRKCIVV